MKIRIPKDLESCECVFQIYKHLKPKIPLKILKILVFLKESTGKPLIFIYLGEGESGVLQLATFGLPSAYLPQGHPPRTLGKTFRYVVIGFSITCF